MNKLRTKVTDMMTAVIFTTEVPKRSSLIILTYVGNYSLKIKFSGRSEFYL